MCDWKIKDRATVAQAIKNEGLEYFVTGYSQSSQMPDKELEAVFIKAEKAYGEFQEVLEELAEIVGIEV
jgi:hypothetical protein|tara:strand:- start:4469 stop:4675 length:207 start_codon:yes stop_codon:yes gene_type:complete